MARKDGCSKCEKRYEELNLLETMRVDCELICGDCLKQLTKGNTMQIKDSGKRETQETGAQSDSGTANIAMELLSPYSLWQLSAWLGKGAEKYAPRNWEKGIPFSICIGKLQRHLQKYLKGQTDESHLAAIGFWWHALTHYESMIELGKLPASLNDLPQYEKEFVVPEGWVVAYNDPGNHHTCGWYVYKKDGNMILWKDGLLHKDGYSGYQPYHEYAQSPGYWPTEADAKAALQQYLEKESA